VDSAVAPSDRHIIQTDNALWLLSPDGRSGKVKLHGKWHLIECNGFAARS
jgi:hypothetical protein